MILLVLRRFSSENAQIEHHAETAGSSRRSAWSSSSCPAPAARPPGIDNGGASASALTLSRGAGTLHLVRKPVAGWRTKLCPRPTADAIRALSAAAIPPWGCRVRRRGARGGRPRRRRAVRIRGHCGAALGHSEARPPPRSRDGFCSPGRSRGPKQGEVAFLARGRVLPRRGRPRRRRGCKTAANGEIHNQRPGRRAASAVVPAPQATPPHEKLVIEGGYPLSGTVVPAGKNAALPIWRRRCSPRRSS